MRRWPLTCFCFLVLTVASSAMTMYVQQNGVLKRGILNVNFVSNVNEYKFINSLQEGQDSLSPVGSNWSTGTVWNGLILDAGGYPCTNQINAQCPFTGTPNPAASKTFGGSISVPASTNYAGTYCFQGFGSGKVLLLTGTWTEQAGNPCGSFTGTFVKTSNGHWTVTDETWSGWCIPITYTGPVSTSISMQVTTDDTNGTGHYIKGLNIYQLSDQTDLLAGKIFRAGFKQPLVSLDPSAIRFMNWLGGNEIGEFRFQDRPLPNNQIGFSGLYSPYVGLVPYTSSSGTNQLAVASATGMPVTYKHGERVAFRAGSTTTNGTFGNNGSNFSQTISSISYAAGTVTVTTTGNHGFADGDTIITQLSGVALLNWYPAVINTSGCGANCYTFSFGTVITGCANTAACGGFASEFYTMNVGSRGSYPLLQYSGTANFAFFFTLTSGSYYQFCLSKDLPGQTDGAGNWIYGAWIPCANGTGNGAQGGSARPVPLEIATALVNELNAMIPVHPINMWFVPPALGVVCNASYCDPDGDASSEYPANAVNVIMNGANGYAGLNSPAQLIVQGGGNELWNSAWGQSAQFAWRGFLRWGNSTSDFDSFSELASLWQINDIKTSPYASARVHYIDAGQMVTGATLNGYNYDRITGSGLQSTGDAQNPIGSVAPITYYDYGFAVAPYVNTGTTTYNTFVGTNASPGTYVTQWISDVNSFGFGSSQAQGDLTNWVTLMQTDAGNSSINSIEADLSAIATLTSTGTVNNGGKAYGKAVAGYEGGWNPTWVAPSYISALSCTGGTVSATTVGTNGYTSNEYIAMQNTSVAGYNGVFQVTGTGNPFTYSVGGSCPVGTPSSTNYQGYYGNATPGTNGFLIAAASSVSWANAWALLMTYGLANPNITMPGFYIEIGPTWGAGYPDTFGAASTEGGGLFPIWTYMETFDQAWQ